MMIPIDGPHVGAGLTIALLSGLLGWVVAKQQELARRVETADAHLSQARRFQSMFALHFARYGHTTDSIAASTLLDDTDRELHGRY